ncbi:site-specific integrase [Aromatoleum evansii]|uniref:Site-specific integrase n=1 Tax=Aromatoleum evansii TaxID=59406 RepID=A0ABZ1AMN7_AROEV|nr:site-specific integrase [Aromatoleum evansii]
MRKKASMPTPWKHPTTGNFYLIKRIPADLVSLYGGRTQVQKSLRTKDRATAEKLLCQEWLKLDAEFEQKRRTAAPTPSGRTSITDDEIQQIVRAYTRHRLFHDELERSAGLTDHSYSETDRLLDETEARDRAAIARGNFRADDGPMQGPSLLLAAEDWLTEHGFDLPPDSPDYRRFVTEFAKASSRVTALVRKRQAGDPVDTPPAEAVEKSIRLSDVIKDFLRDKKPEGMGKKLHAALPKFLEIVGDKEISKVRQTDVLEFLRLIQRIPTQRGAPKRLQGVALRDMVTDEVTMAPATFDNNYISPLRLFLKWARTTYQDQGFPVTLTVEGIEYQGTRREGDEKQRALEQSELVRLFTGPEMKAFAASSDQLHKYWLPHLCLFTGARINELCQLNPQTDIIQSGNAWVLRLDPETEGDERVTKSLKNTSSKRLVPIHPQLLELGFLDYVTAIQKTGAKLLFPAFRPAAGKASKVAREWFADFLRDTGLRDETPGKGVRGSHVFRHTLITAASRHPDPVIYQQIDWVTGHAGEASAVKRGYTEEQATANKLQVLSQIQFALDFIRPVLLLRIEN